MKVCLLVFMNDNNQQQYQTRKDEGKRCDRVVLGGFRENSCWILLLNQKLIQYFFFCVIIFKPNLKEQFSQVLRFESGETFFDKNVFFEVDVPLIFELEASDRCDGRPFGRQRLTHLEDVAVDVLVDVRNVSLERKINSNCCHLAKQLITWARSNIIF